MMRRFFLMFANELKLARATIPIHLIVLFQPSLMFFLMSLVLVTPTFTMLVLESPESSALVAAMEEVTSPSGVAYIDPQLVSGAGEDILAQEISLETVAGQEMAVQHFGLIDSNLLKNYRNRLTAAALIMWHERLGDQAVGIEEQPWLPQDVPYAVYFGMAMLPLTAFLAGALIGGYATAREFETDTVREYNLSPAPVGIILAARLARLVVFSWLAAGVLLFVVGLLTGVWPGNLWLIPLILLPIALTGGCLGLIVAMLLQSSLPTFLICLAVSFVFWLLGGAFGLPAGFSGAYALISRVIPHSYAVELLFPLYYGAKVTSGVFPIFILLLITGLLLGLAALVYRRKIVAIQE